MVNQLDRMESDKTPEACVQKQAEECGGRLDAVRLNCGEQNNKKNNMNLVLGHAPFEES
jgi:hypothetical protein